MRQMQTTELAFDFAPVAKPHGKFFYIQTRPSPNVCFVRRISLLVRMRCTLDQPDRLQRSHDYLTHPPSRSLRKCDQSLNLSRTPL